ncbi:MptD family putative ECF transporter S component [Streptococcus catagoni]|uniref:MptD family putative ECF transporter S component n=1 Tax=Streptococcus catagoni TaxID=2654874 RepID=UPI0014079C10|nr:MptD family putative ECF transporter S component [Streptococcus catagoni]
MKNLKLKDIILTGAFSALYFICVGLGTLISIFLDKSGNMIYAPAFAGLLGGTVYFLLVAKIQKFGAITMLGAIMGFFFFLTGHFVAALFPALIFGLLADGLAYLGRYQKQSINLLSYILFSFANTGPIILMWFLRDTYIKSLLARGKDMAYVNRVMVDLTLANVSFFIFTVCLGALLGGLFGQRLLKKHFMKSGMLS